MAMLAQLRQEGIASKLPEEMKSLDSTVATAEMHYQLNELQNAERYYRLATQKGALIRERLSAASPKASENQPPIDSATMAPDPAPNMQKATPKPPEENPAKESPTAQNASSEQVENTSAEDGTEIISSRLTGSSGIYTVQKNETLRLVAAKLGVNRGRLAAINGLGAKAVLKEGQALKFNNRRIVPENSTKNGIVINIPDRMLYLFQKGKLVYSTAVALGTPTKTENFIWHTPTGKFRIIAREKNPTWTVPPSIQEEMRLEGKEVITSIPPGPENPLGKYAMKTSLPGILIHSTTKPWSIYTYASHGCIRVYPERMEELFSMVKLNTQGEIIYRPVKALVTEDGRVLLEVHADIYGKTKGVEREAKNLLNAMKLSEKVDWEKVKKVISSKAGVAEEITLDTIEAKRSQSQSPS